MTQPASLLMAAKCIRAELDLKYPGVKFSVRSRSFANGNSVDVVWVGGPEKSAVQEITTKYEEGSFDGNTDSYEIDTNPQHVGFHRIRGSAREGKKFGTPVTVAASDMDVRKHGVFVTNSAARISARAKRRTPHLPFAIRRNRTRDRTMDQPERYGSESVRWHRQRGIRGHSEGAAIHRHRVERELLQTSVREPATRRERNTTRRTICNGMISEQSKEETKELRPGSYSERRKLREALGDAAGINRYGGNRCKCSECGDVHWTRAANPKVETE